MIDICPPSIVPFLPSGRITLNDIIQIAKKVRTKKVRTRSQKVKTPQCSRKEYDRQYYLANKERKDAIQREYDAAHKKQIAEYRKARYQRKKQEHP